MATASDHRALALGSRVPRRSALRALTLLGALGGPAAHATQSTTAKKRKKKGTSAKKGKSASAKKGKSKNAKKRNNDNKHHTRPAGPMEGVGPVKPVDPVGPVNPVDPVDPIDSRVALGAYIFNGPGDPQELDRFVNETGRAPAIVMWYEQWGGWDEGRLRLGELEEVIRRGAAPLITWDPWDPYAGLNQPAYRLVNIALGHFDTYIDSWASALAGVQRMVYLRFGHEMNGDWYPWSAGVNGNSAADYVAAWRHIHDRFLAVGATNVRWVWSPNIAYAGSTPLELLYPGDSYVDWVGLDGYNWGVSHPRAEWWSFQELFLPSYQRLQALTAKRMMIAETASTELGGDKAAWIRQAFLEQLPTIFPQIRAVIWFHENKETDWRASSSPAALAAFREVAASPHLQGRLP